MDQRLYPITPEFFAQTILPLLDRTTRRCNGQFFSFDAGGKFLQTAVEPRSLFFELHFFRRKFLKADCVALLLQIKRSNFVPNARQILRGGERGGLRGAQIFLQLQGLLQ